MGFIISLFFKRSHPVRLKNSVLESPFCASCIIGQFFCEQNLDAYRFYWLLGYKKTTIEHHASLKPA